MAADPFAADRAESPPAPRCAACGRTHHAAEWSALTLVRRLGPDELRAYVDPWPPHLVVEARACAQCHTPISRVSAATLRRSPASAA